MAVAARASASGAPRVEEAVGFFGRAVVFHIRFLLSAKRNIESKGRRREGGDGKGEGRRTGCFGFLLLLVQSPVGAFLVAVVLCVGFLLRRFALDLRLHEILGPLSLQLHEGALRLDFFLHFRVTGFGLPACLDLCELHVHVELSLRCGEFCFRVRLFRLALCLQHGGLGVDFGYFLSGAAFLFCFADFAEHAGVGDVDFGLVRSPFVGFAAEELEVFTSLCVLKFLDVCVVAARWLSLTDRGWRCFQKEELTSSGRIDPIHFEHCQ